MRTVFSKKKPHGNKSPGIVVRGWEDNFDVLKKEFNVICIIWLLRILFLKKTWNINLEWVSLQVATVWNLAAI